jgi:hypothetical protein
MSEPFFANSLSIVVSDTGCIHVQLHDTEGQVVAVAAMRPATVPIVVDELIGCGNRIASMPALQRMAPAGRA